MGTIGDKGGSVPPDMKVFYQDKFERSVDLFDRSLDGYQNAEFAQKRGQFKKVMDAALHIMNDAAKAGLSDAAKKESAKLSNQYDEMVAHKEMKQELSPEEVAQLKKQIDRLKHAS
jgi:hypothetical protein